jgi:hypothetical protein
MGDYLRLENGVTVKIGTAGDDRYMRHDEALQYLALDIGGQIDGNLKYRDALWRFPYPGEDRDGLMEIAQRNMFHVITFKVSTRLLPDDHDPICVSVHAVNDQGFGINRLIPCPLSKDDKVYATNVPSPIVQIYGERYDEAGEARTVFCCGYCEKPFSLQGDEELEGFRKAFMDFHAEYISGERKCPEWAIEIAKRFRAARLPIGASP